MNRFWNFLCHLAMLATCGVFLAQGTLFAMKTAATAIRFDEPDPNSSSVEKPLKLLFLGDQRGHQPRTRFEILQPVLAGRQIELTYTEEVADLNLTKLNQFDGLVLYANIDDIAPDQARALLEYVAGGKGFVPLHCASYCFRNSPEVVGLIGGQFREHGTGVFSVRDSGANHPVTKGYQSFQSWDETYVHHLHNEQDRVVLEYRYGDQQAGGNEREPWTWVRQHGRGRVFYTAWGHDERTWSKPGFHNLVERGIRWACSDDPALAGVFRERDAFVMPKMNQLPANPPAFSYEEVGKKIPNYLPTQAWGTEGENLSRMQIPLKPSDSLQHYIAPENFAVKLFAAEPELGAKPIAMTWDHRGRLWVCQTIDYPNSMREPGQGNDRVTICADTDADGVADQFTVFADQLSIPTAITLYRGGAIVQDGVRTLYLKDLDGDDKADQRTILIEGWQMGDTHGGVSNFRYGLDNWIWGMQGYNDSRPRFAGGQAGPFRMGFFRFKLDNQDPPSVTDVEFIRSTDNNTWGLGITEEGLIFGSTANRNPSVFMPIPNRYYERVRGWGPQQLTMIADTHLFQPITDKIRQVDHHGGYTAGAGHAVYTGRRYPQSWWNRVAFVNGPTGHLTGIFELIPDGAGFKSHSPGNLLASDDEWAAPIMSEIGPDGNVWTIDWYNYIVQHNPTPRGFETGPGNAYESDLRDKSHGRILRVVYEGESNPASDDVPHLEESNPQALVAALRHPTMFWRLEAQKLIVQSADRKLIPCLLELLADPSTDEIGLNVGVIHALHCLNGLGAIENLADPVGQAVTRSLSHPSAGVRRNALQVLPKSSAAANIILQKGLVDDSDPQVRLAALLALADITHAEGIGPTLARLSRNLSIVKDPWLFDALISASAVHGTETVTAILADHQPLIDSQLTLLERVGEHLARTGLDANLIVSMISTSRDGNASALIAGLLKGNYQAQPGSLRRDVETKLQELAERSNPADLSQLISLVIQMGSRSLETYAERAAEGFREKLRDEDTSNDELIDSARRLMALMPESEDSVELIVKRITFQLPPDTATQLLSSLAASRSPQVVSKIVDGLSSWTPAVKRTGIRLLLSRSEWTSGLITALESQRLSVNDLAIDERQALANHPNEKIRDSAAAIFRDGGGLPSPDRVAVLDKYLETTQNKGDTERGLGLFKEHCSKCHRHGEMGETVGPDLTGMAVHPKEELLIHILDPSRSVEGNFRAFTVLTIDGRVLNGMLATESKTSIELVDTTGKRETLPREDIEEIQASTKSVMPEGFEQQFDVAAMTDLLAFLTSRGRYLPLDLRKVATLPTDRPMFYGGGAETMIPRKWGQQKFKEIPFTLLDPADGRNANAIMLYGPQGQIPPTMPQQVSIDINTTAQAIHFLGGVGGWSAKSNLENGPAVMTVRLNYADGTQEDHALKDGVHFADYIGDFEVAGSERALILRRGYQLRYLKIEPKTPEKKIKSMELIKVDHPSCPITMAITLEGEPSEGK